MDTHPFLRSSTPPCAVSVDGKLLNIAERERVLEQKEKVVQQLFANAERMKAELEAASISLARKEEELCIASESIERERTAMAQSQQNNETTHRLELELTMEKERSKNYDDMLREIEQLGGELREETAKNAALQHHNERFDSQLRTASNDALQYKSRYEEESANLQACVARLAEISIDVTTLQDSAEKFQKQHEDDDASSKKRIKDLEEELKREQEDRKRVEAMLADAAPAVGILLTEQTALKTQIKALKDSTNRIKRSHYRQKETLDEMVSEMTHLVQTIKLQQADIHARGRAIYDKDAELSNLRSVVTMYKKSYPVVPPPFVPVVPKSGSEKL